MKQSNHKEIKTIKERIKELREKPLTSALSLCELEALEGLLIILQGAKNVIV